MPDDTTAAIKALIEQVAALTETVQKQDALIKGVRDHNVRLLDEVKDAKRAAQPASILDVVEQERRDRAAANANLVRNPDGSMRLASGAGDHGNAVVLTREAARNPAAYREARALAESRGVPLRIASDGDDPTTRNTGKAAVAEFKTPSFDDRHEMIRWVHAAHQTGEGLVNRRLAAEREGFKVRTFNTLDDLPFHARQKFQMMEGAANAQSDS